MTPPSTPTATTAYTPPPSLPRAHPPAPGIAHLRPSLFGLRLGRGALAIFGARHFVIYTCQNTTSAGDSGGGDYKNKTRRIEVLGAGYLVLQGLPKIARGVWWEGVLWVSGRVPVGEAAVIEAVKRQE